MKSSPASKSAKPGSPGRWGVWRDGETRSQRRLGPPAGKVPLHSPKIDYRRKLGTLILSSVLVELGKPADGNGHKARAQGPWT